MMIAIGWNTKTRADDVLVSLYSFFGSSNVDLINPATGTDTGAYISGLSSPSGLAIGADGTIYVALQGNCAWRGTLHCERRAHQHHCIGNGRHAERRRR